MEGVEKIVQSLINAQTVVIKDEIRPAVQKRLREIKKNCTEVLSQMKNF